MIPRYTLFVLILRRDDGRNMVSLNVMDSGMGGGITADTLFFTPSVAWGRRCF